MKKLLEQLQQKVTDRISQLDEKDEMTDAQEELHSALSNLDEAITETLDVLER